MTKANTFQHSPITIERTRYGGYTLSAMLEAGHDSRLFRETYFDFTKREAISLFRAAIRRAVNA